MNEKIKEKIIANIVLYKLNGRDIYQRKRMPGVENMTHPIFQGDNMKEAYKNGTPVEGKRSYSSVEQKLQKILSNHDDRLLNSLLQTNQKEFLEILYQKAISDELDLRQDGTRYLWSHILSYYSEQPSELDTITSEFTRYYRSRFTEPTDGR